MLPLRHSAARAPVLQRGRTLGVAEDVEINGGALKVVGVHDSQVDHLAVVPQKARDRTMRFVNAGHLR